VSNDPSRPDAAIFVLYGATGDLAHRMVLPAFATLAELDLLPARWRLIGSGRGDVSHERFAADVRQSLERAGIALDRRTWEGLRSGLRFAGGDFTADGHGALLREIADARDALGADTTLVHYLAIPPQGFEPMTRAIGRHGLNVGSRAVFEKPYGTSLASFRRLDRVVQRVFDEAQVFRIDHFLGKEATQNLHVLRFGNGLFARMWDRHTVRAVQIDVPETLGITDRADFYDATGVVLDMLVTHLFQVAAEVAMEPPRGFAPAHLQAARESVLGRFRRLDPAEVVIGQYDGYRDVDGVGARSQTPTFVAARLWIDTPRWRGVPFLLRTGKRMHESAQAVRLILAAPNGPFDDIPPDTNVLTFALDGTGRIDLRVNAKAPGVGLQLAAADMEIPLAEIGDAPALAPYARLLHDVLSGDRSLVTRPDGLAHVWRVAQPVLDLDRRPLPYAPGSWGPATARRLAAPDGWLQGD
jgi:glucose-6-phosphate 1-dehydrogenase